MDIVGQTRPQNKIWCVVSCMFLFFALFIFCINKKYHSKTLVMNICLLLMPQDFDDEKKNDFKQ